LRQLETTGLALNQAANDDDVRVELIKDIKVCLEKYERFEREDADFDRKNIPSFKLVIFLQELEESPWKPTSRRTGDSAEGGLEARQLAKMLKPFGIKSKKIRIKDGTVRGYEIAAFEEIFERYLGNVTGQEEYD